MINISLLIGLLIILAAILISLLSGRFNLNKQFYVKLYFALFIITSLCSLLSLTSISIFILIGSLSFFFTFGFVLLHSSEVLGNKKMVIFFTIALLFGLFSEVISVKYGYIYGQYYYNSPFFFGLVAFTIPFLWAVVIYSSYTLTNLFLFGFGGEKPKKTDKLWYFICLLILISSIGGLIALNLDMFVDPVTVSAPVPDWVWIGGGPYFGIPISNFIGWFLVAGLAILIFRLYEAFSPSDDSIAMNIPLNLYIIIIYVYYFISNAVKAFMLGKVEYILIGTATMIPFIIIGLLALMLIKKNNDSLKLNSK
ncbi:MAG: carotenoid biosynthesis protein [Methanobacterium sp.]|nr:carotenoid biosynthesis protein [Methanobacterium sp.]